MTAVPAADVALYPHSNGRHAIGALVLLGALIALPFAGIGPMTWLDCRAGGHAVATAAAPATAAPTESSPPARPAPLPAQLEPATPAPAASRPPMADAEPRAQAATALTEPPAAAAPASTVPAGPETTEEPGAVVYFAFDSDRLSAGSRHALAPIVAFLRAHPDANAQVIGFHDGLGDRHYNEDLAQRRAFAVRAALQRAGIKRERVIVSMPEQAEGDAGAAEARRAEVTIVASP